MSIRVPEPDVNVCADPCGMADMGFARGLKR